MSSTINVHPPTTTPEQVEGNRLKVSAKVGTWPRHFALELEQGGHGLAGNHSTTVFIGALNREAILDLIKSLENAAHELGAYAIQLEAHGNDPQEG